MHLQALVDSIKAKIKVDDEHKFVGLDAYKKVIDSCDVALLCDVALMRDLRLSVEVW